MKCSEVKKILADYASGKLRSMEVAKHLEVCDKCGFEFEKLKKVFSLLSAYEFEEPNEFYWANFLYRVKQRILKDDKHKVFTLKFTFAIPALAVIVIGIFVGMVLSTLFANQYEIYYLQIYDLESIGVLVKPPDFADVSDEIAERAVLYLYEKHHLPSLDELDYYDHNDVNVDEVFRRISNKF